VKGVVFTEFLEMVEEKFSYELTEKIIEASDLSSGGAYTAVGTYDHGEIVQLVTHLSQETGISIPDLLRTFGQHVFNRFVVTYPHFFKGIESSIGFMEKVDGYIHVEVRKLYPDAELPKLEYEKPDSRTLKVIYRSNRPFADLADGMIAGCIAHFNDGVTVRREDVVPGSVAVFTMTKT
jgi:hypothetical protein